MRGIFILVALISSLLGDAISINMDEFRKLTYPDRVVPAKDTIVKLQPIGSGGDTPLTDSSAKRNQAISTGGSYQSGNAKEDARDNLIKELRSALEIGKDFKYYFPNFDYTTFKKDIEAMMRDIVSQ